MEIINKNLNIRLVLIEKAPFKIIINNHSKKYFHVVKKVHSFDEMNKAIILTHGINYEKQLHDYYDCITNFYIIINSSKFYIERHYDLSGTLIKKTSFCKIK